MVRIKVVGVGGAGISVVNRMMASGIDHVQYVAVNTDARAVHGSTADVKIVIGEHHLHI